MQTARVELHEKAEVKLSNFRNIRPASISFPSLAEWKIRITSIAIIDTAPTHCSGWL